LSLLIQFQRLDYNPKELLPTKEEQYPSIEENMEQEISKLHLDETVMDTTTKKDIETTLSSDEEEEEQKPSMYCIILLISFY
jgi:hypothetical protein